jgi:hypothetical protein
MEVIDSKGDLGGSRGEQLIEGEERQVTPNFSKLKKLLQQWVTSEETKL